MCFLESFIKTTFKRIFLTTFVFLFFSHGRAHVLSSDFEFAYTKSQLKIESPLNLFIPNFPYQILWIKIPLDNNPQGIQTFVIDSISETMPASIKNSII